MARILAQMLLNMAASCAHGIPCIQHLQDECNLMTLCTVTVKPQCARLTVSNMYLGCAVRTVQSAFVHACSDYMHKLERTVNFQVLLVDFSANTSQCRSTWQSRLRFTSELTTGVLHSTAEEAHIMTDIHTCAVHTLPAHGLARFLEVGLDSTHCE